MPWRPRGAPKEILAPKPKREPRIEHRIEALFLSCPVCGFSRKLDKSGRWAKLRNKEIDTVKGRVHFGNFDLDDSYLIQIRNVSGGRGAGFPTVGGYRLDQVKNMPEYADLIRELKEACQAILTKLT
jgi:hypothetical protein